MKEKNISTSKLNENGSVSVLHTLPESWSQILFNETIENISTIGKKIKQRDYLASGRFPVIDQGVDFAGGYTNDESNLLDCNLPVIIFGDHTKIVKFVDRPFAPGADGVKGLKPYTFFYPKLFFYFTQVLANNIISKGYARHFQYLSKSIIPLPPLPEQYRIVAKIEQLLSELDKGVAELKKAQENLELYRQSLLKAAFEGRLTKKWRKEHADELESAEKLLARIKTEREKRYQKQLDEWKQAVQEWEDRGKPGRKPRKPRKPKVLPPLTEEKLAELPELPDGWVYSYLSHLGDLARGKSKHRPRNDPRLFGGPYPFIQTAEIKAGEIIKSCSKMYNEFGLQQSCLWPKGTLCITIAANIAETAFLGVDACFPDSVVGFTKFESIYDSKYIKYFIQAIREKIEAYAPATAQKNINLDELVKSFKVYQVENIKQIKNRCCL